MRYRPTPPPQSGDQVITDYLNRELDRIAQTLVTPDPLWEDVRVSLSAIKVGTSNAPGFAQIRSDGAGSVGVFAYLFDDGTREDVYFDVQLPHAFRERSGVLKPHIHWCPITTGTGTVRWGLEYTWANYGDALPTTTIIYVEQAGAGVAYQHQIAAWADLDATGMSISSILMCRVFRDAAHANDTHSGDVAALSIDFHVQLDAQGSEVEYIKRRNLI